MKNARTKRRLRVVKAPVSNLPNILVVDRGRPDASFMGQRLETSAKARLVYAADTATAERMIAEGELDLIVLDPTAPADFDFLKQTKARNRWLAVMVATGVYHVVEVPGRRLIRKGADRLLGIRRSSRAGAGLAHFPQCASIG